MIGTVLNPEISKSRRFKRYPAYKPGGVEWLGDIPKHWEVKRLKYAARTIMGQSPSSEFYTDDPSERPFLQGNAEFMTRFPRARWFCDAAPKTVPSGALLLSVRAPVGALNEADLAYGIGRGLCAIVENGTGMKKEFGWYALQLCKAQLFARATGSTYEAVSADDVGNIQLVLPPDSEQLAIVTFLDRETLKIDALIAKKLVLIERLKEKRSALISRTVTRGLPPDAALAAGFDPQPMKPSGVEWLGHIPANWNVTKLKRLCAVRGRIGFRGYTTDDLVDAGDGALTLGATHMREEGQIDLSSPIFISWAKYYESPEIIIQVGDLLVAQRGSTTGKVAIVNEDIGPATINPSVVLLKQPIVNPKFLLYFLLGSFVQSVFSSYLSATAIPMLSQEQIGSIDVCVPPVTEQVAIAAYLDRATHNLNALIAKGQEAIARLREYRTALISAAVTGKIDVRGTVA
jgi:type I restriction enzyme S subunit